MERFFNEWKEQRKAIENLRAELTRIKTEGGSSTIKERRNKIRFDGDGGDFKDLMSTLAELTRNPDDPTVAVLTSKTGGAKIVVAITENSIASQRHNASKIVEVMAPETRAVEEEGQRWHKPAAATLKG